MSAVSTYFMAISYTNVGTERLDDGTVVIYGSLQNPTEHTLDLFVQTMQTSISFRLATIKREIQSRYLRDLLGGGYGTVPNFSASLLDHYLADVDGCFLDKYEGGKVMKWESPLFADIVAFLVRDHLRDTSDIPSTAITLAATLVSNVCHICS